MKRISLFLLILAIQFAAGQTMKIATYNIYFLDDGISAERKESLQTVIRELDADVIACEEINNPAALRNIVGDTYQIAMIDDTSEVQEVALLVREPFNIVSQRYVFPDTLYDFEFPRSRDLLEVTVEGYNREFVFLVHHAKSRRGGREKNDPLRNGASKLILRHLQSEEMAGKNVIVLGDFNDNPDDRSLNILEYGDPDAPAGIDKTEDTFLFNTSESLLEKDYGSYGYNFLLDSIETETFDPTAAGSRAENNKWRGKTHDYMKDVKVKITLLDNILVSMSLKPYVKESGVFNRSSAVRGSRSSIRFENDKLVYKERGSFASDHIPVWVTLAF